MIDFFLFSKQKTKQIRKAAEARPIGHSMEEAGSLRRELAVAVATAIAAKVDFKALPIQLLMQHLGLSDIDRCGHFNGTDHDIS